MNTDTKLHVRQADWPIAGAFTIARGSRTTAQTVIVEIGQNGILGRGECTPYARYGESTQTVAELIESVRSAIEGGFDRQDVQRLLPAGAARNAVDCALWDFEAKSQGRSVAELAGIAPLQRRTTAFTISLNSAEKMASDCRAAAKRQLLKIKLGGDGDQERMLAVREAAPNAKLILDANESWTSKNLEKLLQTAKSVNADVIEQPLPANEDAVLTDIKSPIPLCADESFHTRDDLEQLREKYDCVNIKLDKTGGLTEALAVQQQARDLDYQIMIGCMVASSLAMAPAMILAQNAEFVDLDGPLLLAKDCDNPIEYPGSFINPPSPSLWG